MVEPKNADEVQLPVRYVGANDVPILLANQFLLQVDEHGGGFILSIAQLAPPILMGSIEQRRAQAGEIGRYSLARERAEALAGLLERALAGSAAEDGEAPEEPT
jgi:hypothetical protein